MSEPRRIDPAELDYHRKLVDRVRWAEAAEKEAMRVAAAFASWSEHLHEKYGIVEPGFGVAEDGEIRAVNDDGRP